MKPAKRAAQPAGARTDAPRRSTRREIEACLLACVREGRTFQLRNDHDDGGALLALRLDVCDVSAQATS